MFLFGSLLLVFNPFGVCDLGRDELLFEVFLVVVIPLKEVLFIVRGDRREENVMDVLVSVIAVMVAAGCFIAILLSDLKSKSKKPPAGEPSKDEQ